MKARVGLASLLALLLLSGSAAVAPPAGAAGKEKPAAEAQGKTAVLQVQGMH